MTVSSLVFFAVVLLTFTNGFVYRTRDGIVIEGERIFIAIFLTLNSFNKQYSHRDSEPNY